MSGLRYNDPAWRRVRLEVLARDGHRCRISGPKCKGLADQVDHIIEVDAGGARLDPTNLRASCSACNQARAARKKHREGWRRSDTRIVLVAGPPGAGKSTLVAERAGPRDLVVDYDTIAQALGSQTSHGHGSHEVTSAARNAVLNRIRRGDVDAPTGWIVSANPKAERMFPHHEVELVDPGLDEVLRRCREAGRPARWEGLVRDWYASRPEAVGPSREW